MPYAKVLPIRSAKGLSSKLGYICSVTHRNHINKIVESPYFYRCDNKASFLATTVSAVTTIKAQKKCGRRVKIFADEVIVRTPDGSKLSAAERQMFVENILQDCFPDSPGVAVWHIDKYTGSADVHIIVANLRDSYPPVIRRSGDLNPLSAVRGSSDRITDFLNEQRHAQSINSIETMRDVKLRQLREMGFLPLAEQLAALMPFMAIDLPKKIQQLGHEVNRYSISRNYISVRFKGTKKAHRIPIDRLFDDTVSLGKKSHASGNVDASRPIGRDTSVSL